MIRFAEYADLPSANIVPCLNVVSSGDPERYRDSIAGAIRVGIFGRLFGRCCMFCRFGDGRNLLEGGFASKFLLFIGKILQRGVN
jgi:hypothetical protein